MTEPLLTRAPGLLVETAAARVSLAAPVGRLSLRGRGDMAPFGSALALMLPSRIGARAVNGTRAVLCLGPDEWVVIVAPGEVDGIVEACAALYPDHPHSLVDVSSREVTLVIDGPRATELLTFGMARDPESIAVGEGRRTAIDGLSVVLWRDAEDAWRIDVWNSFAEHLLGLLETGCRELAAEPV